MTMRMMIMTNKNPSIEECIFDCMDDFRPWTYWKLKEVIYNRHGKFYGEPTISAGIRNIRKTRHREKFNLPMTGEVVIKERIIDSKGYTFRLSPEILNHWRKHAD